MENFSETSQYALEQFYRIVPPPGLGWIMISVPLGTPGALGRWIGFAVL